MPIYPETNFLDLGLYMKIQSSVQKVHRGRRCTHADSAKSVSDSWNKSLSVKKFRNLHGRLRVVLFCVVYGKWLNEFVEKKRGKLFCYYTLPNDETGSDGSVSMHCITATALQAKDEERDVDLDDP